jgi:hypothetical protein
MTLKIASFFGTSRRTTVETAERRPATILSPYGEGYCKVCRFIEPLSPDGRIEEHFRSEDQDCYATRVPCKGSRKRPPATHPYRSTLSAFRLTARKAVCPRCSRAVSISPGQDPFFLRHGALGFSRTSAVQCPNSWEPVPPK